MCNKLNILVVGGHPADVFDHCGGTLAHHIKRGDHVTCVALTQGLRVHDKVISDTYRYGVPKMSKAELDKVKKEREQVKYTEVIDACALFGIKDVRFLSYDDKVLLVKEEMIDAVAKVIRDIKADIVITHYPLENGGVGSHHGNTGKIVLEAIGLGGSVDFDDPNPPCRVKQVFFMCPLEALFKATVLSGEPSAYCDYYVDIMDVAELKVRALDMMRSQQYNGAYAKRHTECWSGKDGHCMTVGYAEGFVTYKPEIGYYLRLSEELYERANENEKVQRERASKMIAEFMDLPE